MRRIGTLGAVLMVTVIGLAHEVTYRGTVVALEATKYAQPGGGTLAFATLPFTYLGVSGPPL